MTTRRSAHDAPTLAEVAGKLTPEARERAAAASIPYELTPRGRAVASDGYTCRECGRSTDCLILCTRCDHVGCDWCASAHEQAHMARRA